MEDSQSSHRGSNPLRATIHLPSLQRILHGAMARSGNCATSIKGHGCSLGPVRGDMPNLLVLLRNTACNGTQDIAASPAAAPLLGRPYYSRSFAAVSPFYGAFSGNDFSLPEGRRIAAAADVVRTLFAPQGRRSVAAGEAGLSSSEPELWTGESDILSLSRRNEGMPIPGATPARCRFADRAPARPPRNRVTA